MIGNEAQQLGEVGGFNLPKQEVLGRTHPIFFKH
jgi:hypothetical protein